MKWRSKFIYLGAYFLSLLTFEPIAIKHCLTTQIKALLYIIGLLIKYRWSHTVCQTDFLPNQLLRENIYDLFLLCRGDFWSFHWCSFLSVNANMGRKTNVCRFCSLIIQPSFFVIPKVCLTASVFYFLKLVYGYLFEEIYASLFTFVDFRCHRMWVLWPMLNFYEWSWAGKLFERVKRGYNSYKIICLKQRCYRPTVGTSSTEYFR